jgi:hypothetical protein
VGFAVAELNRRAERSEQSCPVAPEKPLASDCCDGGCEHCVFEVYAQALAEFERARRAWQAGG